jgi:two-component system LytT family sensor kinase
VLAIAGVWTGLVLLSIAGGVLASQQAGRPIDWHPWAASRAIDWYSCAVFTPLYIWMARRWPIERATWRRRVPAWLTVTCLIVPLKYLLQDAALRAFLSTSFPRPIGETIIAGFIPEMIAFWSMIGVILCVEYYDRWRHREIEGHVLARQLAEARLEMLSAQLRPHFLFNTLQGISTLLHRDPQAADQMLTRLSELLRHSLRHEGTPEVPLSEELATLEHYLSIQRIRFADRLAIRVSSDGVGDALVPHFILQPLVENAIEHGVARRSGPDTVSVSAHGRGDRLVLEVSDEGGSSSTREPRARGGMGLTNTRARLAAMYGHDASLDAMPRDQGGFVVTIGLPLRRAGAAVS